MTIEERLKKLEAVVRVLAIKHIRHDFPVAQCKLCHREASGARTIVHDTECAVSYLMDGPPVPTDMFCSVCFEPQFDSPSGEICKNGHFGAPGLTAAEAQQESKRRHRSFQP